MLDSEAGLRVRYRVLLILLLCLGLPFVGGCSGDPECFAVPFLPKCFDDDDEEEKPNDTATQASAIRSRPAPSDLSPWLREGYRRFVPDAFLVKKVEEIEPVNPFIRSIVA
jgi:hypothetical protein